jgi:hypothetical protein
VTAKRCHLGTILRCQSIRIRIISSRPEMCHRLETATGPKNAATAAMAAIVPFLLFNYSFA